MVWRLYWSYELISSLTIHTIHVLLYNQYIGHDAIVLSAFGCGAFCNPPATIAQLFWEVISSGYGGGVEKPKTYRQIVFAIFDDHNANRRHNDEGNLLPFQRRFEQGLDGPDRIIVHREGKEDQ